MAERVLESEEQANLLDKVKQLDEAELKLVLHYIEFLQQKGLVAQRRWEKANLVDIAKQPEKGELKLVLDFIAFMGSVEGKYQPGAGVEGGRNRELAKLVGKIKRLDTPQVKMMLHVAEFIEESGRRK